MKSAHPQVLGKEVVDLLEDKAPLCTDLLLRIETITESIRQDADPFLLLRSPSMADVIGDLRGWRDRVAEDNRERYASNVDHAVLMLDAAWTEVGQVSLFATG